ncbi:uncharacterized protein KQ657_003787 [Scheffersomyces spartinae]|uniref:CID domain-containing protein n=1 Tax=Scheffersomyces spartinae TaxID=45513 RepID=A0A9P7VD12_9ASCO|nr:uncharacterized protein KQ657_003787 [Scheffersomyces spartinae]KAG7195261.1 hypothetical protein KQ657_003787 [Scheffersomyces spartinae]
MSEPFDENYYNHLLTLLTINSRAIIAELTSIAETHLDELSTIVKLIVGRIRRCLPLYKLYLFYLIDSIVKNVGSPYNVLFSSELFALFTETYTIVKDSVRQDLIDLFKTWVNARTQLDSELFPSRVIGSIEKFIIKATTIPVSSDSLLREANYLLQYVIKIDSMVEGEIDGEWKEDDKNEIHQMQIVRNKMVWEINEIHEKLFISQRDDRERDASNVAALNITNANIRDELVEIRKTLDNHFHKQQELLRRKESQVMESIDKLNRKMEFSIDKAWFTASDDVVVNFMVSWGHRKRAEALVEGPKKKKVRFE